MSIGDLLVQGMQGLQGPNPRPNPMPQTGPGGASPGSGAPANPRSGLEYAPPTAAPPPNLPPPQTYGPDPSTAASIQALMQMHEQDRRANGVDRGMAMMAGSFGPLETRGAIMNSAQPEDDHLHAMAQSTLLQNAQTAQTEHNRAMAGAEALGANMGLKPGVSTELGNLGELGPVAAATVTPTPEQKQADAAADAYAKANPNATPEEIARFKSNVLTNMVDPAARAANQDIAVKMAEAKNPAAYNKADTQLELLQQNLDWLKAHPEAAKTAVTAYDFRLGVGPEGALGYAPILGTSAEAKEAKTKLDQMMKQLSAESLANSGMSRMAQMEFGVLGNSMTNLGSKNVPASSVMDEIDRLKEQTLRLRANVKAQAGLPLDKEYSGYADPRYGDKSSPYYTGAHPVEGAPAFGTAGTGALPNTATASAPVSIKGPEDIAKLPHGTPFVIPDGPNKGKTGYAQ